MVGRLVRALCLGPVLVSLLACAAGNVAFRQGRKAELRKDYDTALVQYEKAVQTEPDNPQYLIHEKQARLEASDFHLRQGRRLLASGRQEEAAGEFQKAVSIDPTNETAAQELSRLLAAQAAARRARETALKESLKAGEEAGAPTTVQLKPFPAEPLAHFKITADSRKVFETVCKLADLNVAFTSDFSGKPLPIDLTNVKVEDVLRVVALQTKTFWRPVTPNTILVVPDTPNNRRDYDEEVLRTIYLSQPLAAADRTAITTALKQVLGLQRIIDNPDSNAIVIRDTPAKVAAAEKMVRELDRSKAEVLVEVAILEADRDRIRDLGLVPGGTTTPQASLVFTPPSTSSSSTSALPLNQLGRLSSSDFSVILPGAVASALLNDTHTRILQNPQVRVTDGQTAKLRIGTRIPYATGSFLPGVSAGTAAGISMLASTQFQYQDVGVNLDLTPHLLINGEVGLHAMIEISSLGASINIGGVQQPTFGQRRIEHDIRLKEGEVSLLGGLIQSTETRTYVGVPGLGQIPILGHLFSGQRTERAEIEVLVMLTPRVIRLPEAKVGARGVPVAGGEAQALGPEAAPVPVPETPPAPPGQPQ
jgi:general secretion pathway protein D